MKLSEFKAETEGIVKTLADDRKFISRITSIGMSEGARFEVIKNDRNMPVLIYVRNTLLALNRKDCEKIEAEVIARTESHSWDSRRRHGVLPVPEINDTASLCQ